MIVWKTRRNSETMHGGGGGKEAGPADEERNGVNVVKNVFFSQTGKGEDTAAGSDTVPVFTTVPLSPVAPQHIPTRLINVAITNKRHPL